MTNKLNLKMRNKLHYMNMEYIFTLLKFVNDNKEACAEESLHILRSDKVVSSVADQLVGDVMKDETFMALGMLEVALHDLVNGAEAAMNARYIDDEVIALTKKALDENKARLME